MRATTTTALLLIATVCFSQKPSGLWKGTIHTDTYTYDIGFDLRIDSNNNITGYARYYNTVNEYAETYVEGKYDPSKKRAVFAEVHLAKTNMKMLSEIVPGRYDLTLVKKTGELKGYVQCSRKGAVSCKKTKGISVKKFKARKNPL